MEHALTSIAVASPLIHVFDAPTTFLDALWLPYRRDKRQLEAAVEAAGPVKAVFAHADVVRTVLASLPLLSVKASCCYARASGNAISPYCIPGTRQRLLSAAQGSMHIVLYSMLATST